MDDSNERRVLWVGNLADTVTEDLLYELFLQAGPLESVKIPKDKSGAKRNFAFITFKHEESVPYTIALMEDVSLCGKPLKLQTRAGAEIESNPYLKILRKHRHSLHSNNGTNLPYDRYSRQNSRHNHNGNGNERNHIKNGQHSRYEARRYSQSSELLPTTERERDNNKNCNSEEKRSIVKDNFRNSPSDYQRSQNSPKFEVPPFSVLQSTPPPPLPCQQMPFPFGTSLHWNQQEHMRMFYHSNNNMPLPVTSKVLPFQQFGSNR